MITQISVWVILKSILWLYIVFNLVAEMGVMLFKDESYQIIGICMDVHKQLGAGFLEIVYKDALEFELKKVGIIYEREKEYSVNYKGIILPHKFYADFVVFGKIILEVKSVSVLSSEFTAHCLNYLKVSGCRLALLINFGELSLNYKRIIL